MTCEISGVNEDCVSLPQACSKAEGELVLVDMLRLHSSLFLPSLLGHTVKQGIPDGSQNAQLDSHSLPGSQA